MQLFSKFERLDLQVDIEYNPVQPLPGLVFLF